MAHKPGRRRKRPESERPRPGKERPRPRQPAAAVAPLVQAARYTWAFPTTLVGLIAGVVVLGTGGRAQRRRGALEFHGGGAVWAANLIGFDAMTLGHVILGRDACCLDMLRDHEQAHVRQVERWGPFFLPAYLGASVLAWWRGGDYYRDNWFERDARQACGERE